jgi:hypothetical protein
MQEVFATESAIDQACLIASRILREKAFETYVRPRPTPLELGYIAEARACPCDDCPARQVCVIECPDFRQYVGLSRDQQQQRVTKAKVMRMRGEDTQPIGTRVSAQNLAELQRIAREEQRSLSFVVGELLRSALEARRAEQQRNV